jgi:flagellar motor switch protein FliM
VALPDKFPVFIGQSELFKALIVEDHDKLLLSDLRETLAGKSYD